MCIQNLPLINIISKMHKNSDPMGLAIPLGYSALNHFVPEDGITTFLQNTVFIFLNLYLNKMCIL
jgi:hypothetical protein